MVLISLVAGNICCRGRKSKQTCLSVKCCCFCCGGGENCPYTGKSFNQKTCLPVNGCFLEGVCGGGGGGGGRELSIFHTGKNLNQKIDMIQNIFNNDGYLDHLISAGPKLLHIL